MQNYYSSIFIPFLIHSFPIPVIRQMDYKTKRKEIKITLEHNKKTTNQILIMVIDHTNVFR